MTLWEWICRSSLVAKVTSVKSVSSHSFWKLLEALPSNSLQVMFSLCSAMLQIMKTL